MSMLPNFSSQRLARLLDGLTRIERFVATGAFMLMVLIAFLDVALREFFGHGIDGAREAAVLLMVVLVMTGHGLATSAGRQLRPRFTDGLVPERAQPVVRRIGDLISAIIYAILAALAAILVGESMALGELSSVLRIPHWIVQLVLPLAFASAVLRHAVFSLCPDLKPQADLRELMERGPTAS